MKTEGINTVGLIIFSILLFISCNQEVKDGAMTVTTNSEKALELYQKGYEIAYGVVELDKAVSFYEQATKEDTNFFMAYYQLATYNLFHNNDKEFEENVLAAVQCNTELSKGEEIQKKALKAWLKNRNTNNSNLGLQLVELYPNDPDALINLGFFYYMDNDYINAIPTFEKANSMERLDNKYCGPKLAIVPVCLLGYSYLITGQLDNAKTSFDNYIKQFPDEQNPYDCKADYFMTTKEYDEAYRCYMTAYKIDTTFQIFFQRALEAKNLYDSLQIK